VPSGADLVVRALHDANVRVVFGLPGVHNLALWRAVAESPIRLVGVRHEQAAAYAADGYARAGGELGVALTTTGPGAANTLAAVGEAWASRQPVLVIATDVPTTVRRRGVWRGSLHEATDQAAMFEPVVKRTLKARSAASLGTAIAACAAEALAPPRRPVYLEIPTDLLAAEAGEPGVQPEPRSRPTLLAEDQLAAAAERIAPSRRPLIWAGGGALQAGAGKAVGALAEHLVAPVITTYSARGLLPPDHPCLVGAPPHVPEVGALWDEADLVIAIGSDLDGPMTQNWSMPQPPHLIAINVDPEDAAKSYLPDVTLEADARAATELLARRVEQRGGHDALARRLRELEAEVRRGLSESDPDALEFLDSLERALPEDATVICDMCIPGYWLGGFGRVPAPRRLSYPLGWGTLGCAFPQALGAALSAPGPVVSVSGDGGFLYAAGELATAAQEQLPLTAVIVDDGGYGMLRFDQDRRGYPQAGVDLQTPDFAALAKAFGVRAFSVDGLGADFGAALARQVALDEPSVLVAKAALGPPPNVSPRWYRTQGISR
jgi:thiamine pyrophosphate-dependent acetolactate synthase large subunit-like protein